MLRGVPLAAALAVSAFAAQAETVKIAFMDPLSGPFANVGQNQLKSFQFIADFYNKANPKGVQFEIVPFDNKGSPQESLNTLKAAIDQGIRYVTQGNGSGAAAAILDAVDKYNARNPGKEMLYLNYAAVDPALTNEKCSYWHFRLDADTTMKMEALTSFMKDQPEIKKVYLINQNYAHGQQVSRYFKETIARKRPDVQIVGDDLHPIAQVKDFAPYVAKIKASGADSIVTGNWGTDLTLLVKAANEAGLTANFYTYYAGVSGTPTALAGRHQGQGARGRLCAQQPAGRAEEAAGRLQGQVQRRLVHRRHLQRPGPAVGGDEQGQEHRPGEGRGGARGPAHRRRGRRDRDAQDRPPVAAGPVHQRVGEGRRQAPVQRREHRLQLPRGQGDPGLRGEHADLVPDEAPLSGR